MSDELVSANHAFLSTLPVSREARLFTLAVVVVSAVIFLVALPFAKLPLAPVPAFIPFYESALATNDLITAVLLFGQFAILRAWALLALAVGYLFTAFLAVAHELSFPDAFSATGLLGAGPQTTAWLYMLWHAGFPLFVIAYALLKGRHVGSGSGHIRVAILSSIVACLMLAGTLTLLVTAGKDSLPSLILGLSYTPTMNTIVSGIWVLSLLAFIVLWRRRPHSVLDLWLMVVMCAWIFDVALAAVFDAARFDLGWYAGRIYGLMASTFVLLVLLLENGMLYAGLVKAHASEQRGRRFVEKASADLQAANKELETFSYSVSHDLHSPLRAINGYAQMLAEDHSHLLDSEGNRMLGVIRDSGRRMVELIDDLLAFSRLGRQAINATNLDMAALAAEVWSEIRADPRIEFKIVALPVTRGDRSLLKQVWVNLLSNAVKYSSKREKIVVEVTGSDDGKEAIYSVRDNGAGFDMRYYNKLFGVFQRLHDADEFPGTGVGLAIVQRIVTRHGGRIWADSTPGEGAVFSFALPSGG
jgi:signal transduction histidine kinase